MKKLSLESYSAYKDSGFEWMEDVPEHWSVIKLKDVASYQEGPGIMADDFKEYGVPLIRISGMKNSCVTLDGCNYLDPTKADRKWAHFKLKLGELIVSASATTGIAAKVTEAAVGAIPYTGLIKFKPLRIMNAAYLQYFLTTKIYTNQIDLQKTGSTIQHYGPTHLGRVFAIVPPPSEQVCISKYLEKKTELIDRKIDLLTEKANIYNNLKQSLINKAVTRGLDRNVELKNSEVEWIEAVPIHWKIKRIAEVASQNKIKNIGLSEKNLLSLSYGRIIQKDFNSNFGLLPESFETYQIVKAGTIILRLTDLQNDQKSLRVGLVREKGIITSAYLGLCFNRPINPAFAYYLLHVYDLCKVFYWFGGGLRSTMRYNDIKVIPFFLPPSEEQDAIVKYLDEKSAKIDRIIETIQLQIKKLKELRKTLINDVVTGKIKVVNEGPAA